MKIRLILFIFLLSARLHADWKIDDYLYGFFIENYDFTSSCHRNVFDYEFDEENLPTIKAQICYPEFLPDFLHNPELKKVYYELEQWVWISEAIRDLLPHIHETEIFYRNKIDDIKHAPASSYDPYAEKLIKNLKIHGVLSRSIDEISDLLEKCPENDSAQRDELNQRMIAARQGLDLIMRETPIITNELFADYLDGEKEKRELNYEGHRFRGILLESLQQAYTLTSDRRNEYTQILGEGIVLGKDVQRSETDTNIENFQDYIHDVVRNKKLVMELLSTSAPEDKAGFERLSAARCELQAKVWASDAAHVKSMFYFQSILTIATVGVSSGLSAGNAGLKGLAIGTEVSLLSIDLNLIGTEYLEKKSECEVYQNTFYMDNTSSEAYLECLDDLSDIKKTVLVAVATGGISTGLILRAKPATSLVDDALRNVPDSTAARGTTPGVTAPTSPNPVSAGRVASSSVDNIVAGKLELNDLRNVGNQALTIGEEVLYRGREFRVGRIIGESISGRGGTIYDPIIIMRDRYQGAKLVLMGATTKGGPLKEVSSIGFSVLDSYSVPPRRVLEIGLARTSEQYRGRGGLTQLYRYIFDTFNTPPITAKKSYFIATNKQTFMESLILQIDPDYLLFNPMKSDLLPYQQEKFMAEAFAKCCADEFMDVQKNNTDLYDRMVNSAFKDTPSGRQTSGHFPNLCENNVHWEPLSNEMSIKMLHCL